MSTSTLRITNAQACPELTTELVDYVQQDNSSAARSGAPPPTLIVVDVTADADDLHSLKAALTEVYNQWN